MTNNASESPSAEENQAEAQVQASPKRDFTTPAEQAAFLQEMMTKPINAKSLLEDSEYSPVGNYREEKYLPSRRFKPLELKVNGNKRTAYVLVITGEVEEGDNLQTMVKKGVEPYMDQMMAQSSWTEKDLVANFPGYMSGQAADTWKQVIAEITITEEDGKYPTGTFLTLVAEWLARLHNKPAMRDNFLAFLRAGKLRKGKASARTLLIWLKTCLRIICWQKGTEEWPEPLFFIKCFYNAMKGTHRSSFKAQHSTSKIITLEQIADFMTLQEQGETMASVRGDRRPRDVEQYDEYRPKRSRRDGRAYDDYRPPSKRSRGRRDDYRRRGENKSRRSRDDRRGGRGYGRQQQGGRHNHHRHEQRKDRRGDDRRDHRRDDRGKRRHDDRRGSRRDSYRGSDDRRRRDREDRGRERETLAMAAEDEESDRKRSPSPSPYNSASPSRSRTSFSATGSEASAEDNDNYVGDAAVDSAQKDMLQLDLKGDDMFVDVPPSSPAAEEAKEENEANGTLLEELAYLDEEYDAAADVENELDMYATEEGVEVDYEADMTELKDE